MISVVSRFPASELRCLSHLRYLQTGPASLVKVLLSENQLFTAIEGAP